MQSAPEHTTAIFVARENVARLRKLANERNTAERSRLLALLKEEEAKLTALIALQNGFKSPSTEV